MKLKRSIKIISIENFISEIEIQFNLNIKFSIAQRYPVGPTYYRVGFFKKETILWKFIIIHDGEPFR